MSDVIPEPRGERRDKKRLSRLSKMVKHGRGLAQIYRNAVLKRVKKADEK